MQLLVGFLGIVAGVAALLLGHLAVSVFVGVVALAAYFDLRRLFAPIDHPVTFVLGALGVAGFVWTGYDGELDLLPAIAAALVLALLVVRIVLYEAGSRTSGVVSDLSSTLGAAAVVGVLAAHVLLLRAVPRWGMEGLVALASMVVAADVAAFFVGRIRGRHALNKHIAPNKTWEGALAGFVLSSLVGLVFGIVVDPPFDISSGLAFGAGVGILVPLGDLAFSAIERSAGVRHSASYFGAAGGMLDLVDGFLFAAPAFYWAFRTIAL